MHLRLPFDRLTRFMVLEMFVFLLKINCHAFFDVMLYFQYWYVFHEFLEPNIRFTFKIFHDLH
jgi:hypothetical protein